MTTSTQEEIRVGAMAIRFLVEGAQSGGSVSVFEFDVPAGWSVAAAHSHDGYEETIYGLAGALTWTVDGDETDVAEGEALVIPLSTGAGRVRKLPSGKLEIIVDKQVPIDEWLQGLPALINAAMA